MKTFEAGQRIFVEAIFDEEDLGHGKAWVKSLSMGDGMWVPVESL
jgi:hypothetical protein